MESQSIKLKRNKVKTNKGPFGHTLLTEAHAADHEDHGPCLKKRETSTLVKVEQTKYSVLPTSTQLTTVDVLAQLGGALSRFSCFSITHEKNPEEGPKWTKT